MRGAIAAAIGTAFLFPSTAEGQSSVRNPDGVATPREFAQWFRNTPVPTAPPSGGALSAPPAEEEAADEPAASTTASPAAGGEYVFAGDLAKQLRQIDPKAKVEWDGRALRIDADGQKFAIFPSGREMVINGSVEKSPTTLRISGEEIYLPQSIVTRIGQELENKTRAAGPGAASTTTTLAAPPTPSPVPTVLAQATPEGTVLPEVPDETPVPAVPTAPPANEVASPTPEATPTPRLSGTPVRPELTPVLADNTPVAAPTPWPTSPPATAVTATPFPVSTATPRPTATPPPPTPSPTPQATRTPKPTPTPRARRDRATPTPQPALDVRVDANDPLKLALRDKADLDNYRIPTRRKAELESLASANRMQKVVIHPDDSDLDSTSEYRKQAAAISLQISQKLKTQLEAKGISAELTRNSAERVALGKELEIINNSNAQALIIVSVGQNPDFQEIAGYRVLYVTDAVDFNAVKSGNVDGGEEVPLDLNYRSFQTGNRMLGTALHNSLREAVEREPVGINPAPLYLGKRAPMSSAAVVAGYLTNASDRRRLEDPQQQDKLAGALADGIQEFGNHLGQAGGALK